MKRLALTLLITLAIGAPALATYLGVFTPNSQIHAPCPAVDTLRGFYVKPDSVQQIVKFGRGANVTSFFRTTGANAVTADWIDSTLDGGAPTWVMRDTVADIDADSGNGLYTMILRSWTQTKSFDWVYTFEVTNSRYGKMPSIRAVVHAVSSNTTFDVDTTLLGFSNGYDLLGCTMFLNRHGSRPSFFRTGINRAVNGGAYDTLTMIDTLTLIAGDTITFYANPWWDFIGADSAQDLISLGVWQVDSNQTFGLTTMGRLMILAAAAGADTAMFKTMLANNGFTAAKDSTVKVLKTGQTYSIPRVGQLNDSMWFKTVEMNLGKILGSAEAAKEFLRACVPDSEGGMHVTKVDTADYADTLGSQVASSGTTCDDPAGVRFVVRVWDATNSAAVPNAVVTIRPTLTATVYDHQKKANASGNAVFTIDTSTYYIFVESPGLSFPDSAYHIAGADSILISGTGRTVVSPAAPSMAVVDGYLAAAGYETGDTLGLCAYCDVVFELIGDNCTDTTTSSERVIFNPTVRVGASAEGYFSAQLWRTDQLKCEDNQKPKWRMTVYQGDRRWTTREFTFWTDQAHVNLGEVLK